MGDIPTTAQLALLIVALAVFAAGGVSAWMRSRTQGADLTAPQPRALRLVAKAALYLGIALLLAVLALHGFARKSWKPLDDNFASLLWMALLLALFVAYTQRAHPLRGLDFFVIPVVLLLIVLAIVFGQTRPHAYTETPWAILHITSNGGGFVAFAIAGALGAMYISASYRLRHKKILPGQMFGSLERLENLTFIAVTLGFALLTVGMITGLFRVLAPGSNSLGPDWYRNPKVVLACVAWVVYALVLHSPINPAFRGLRTALLSVVGFLLMIGAVVAVEFMPNK